MKSEGKIKIAHVVLNLDIGGLEMLVVDMIKAMDRSCFDVVVFCLRQKGGLAQELESLGFRVYGLGGKDCLNWGAFFKLAGFFRKEKVDIVHCHNTAGYLYGGIAAVLSGFRRVIYTEHGRVFPDTPRRMLIERVLSWFTYKIVAVSEDMKRCLAEYEKINPKKIQVIHNGIDTAKFHPLGRDARCQMRDALGIAQEDFVIGNVARFDPVKGHETLLRAFAKLLQEKDQGSGIRDEENQKGEGLEGSTSSLILDPSSLNDPSSLKLLLVGDGEEFKKIQALCGDLNLDFFDLSKGVDPSIIYSPFFIIFTGVRTDIPDLLNIMDVFVLPSKNEGISLTLLEALACGVPVVATRVGGNPEVIEDGQNGMLCEPGDPKSLSEAIARIIDDGGWDTEKSFSIVNSSFSLDKMMKQYEELYAGR